MKQTYPLDARLGQRSFVAASALAPRWWNRNIIPRLTVAGWDGRYRTISHWLFFSCSHNSAEFFIEGGSGHIVVGVA